MKDTMIQEVMVKPHEIEFREIPVPEITKEQVLVKVKRIGVCGSDIHVFHGQHPYVTYPLTQGHEVSAQIVKVGENYVTLEIAEGTEVVVQKPSIGLVLPKGTLKSL